MSSAYANAVLTAAPIQSDEGMPAKPSWSERHAQGIAAASMLAILLVCIIVLLVCIFTVSAYGASAWQGILAIIGIIIGGIGALITIPILVEMATNP